MVVMGVAAFVAAEMIPEANPMVRFACSLIISVTNMFSHLGFLLIGQFGDQKGSSHRF